jgi:hypothetical protein
MSTTVQLDRAITSDPELLRAIALVGNVVTYLDQQWTVQEVEGIDWYAFDDDGVTTVDCGLTRAPHRAEPLALVISADGESKAWAAASQLKRGVCLVKA